MYRVFSRQTESAELSSTALGLHGHAANPVDTCTLPDARNREARKDAGCGLAYSAAAAGTHSPRVSSLERKPTPAVIPDVCKSTVLRRHRRSCHGTVLDDEQQGGTGVTRSCASLAPESTHSSDGMAFVVFPGKDISVIKAGTLRKDVGSRQQVDQQQQCGIARHLNDLNDTAVNSIQPVTSYVTPFAAPDVQACRCHKRYQQCKQHPRSPLQKLAKGLRGLVQCGASQTAY